jgi:hypothetical protein
MAFKLADRIKETTTTTGTGNVTLAGAVSQFRAFSAEYSNNDTFYYAIVGQSGTEWEVGIGTYVSATPAIARTTVLESSNSGSLVNFSAGTKDVWVDVPAAAVSPVRPVNDFRLTLTSGTPVTIADVTAATTIYAALFGGNQISLYENSHWQVYASAEMSLALGTLTANKNYDVFCYLNSGVPTLELGAAWTNDTTRATALAYQDGVLVKSGDATRRYLGTFRTISTTETCDTERRRFTWNNANRVKRKLKVLDTTDSWNYSTAAYRQANGNAANQLEVLVGVVEEFHTISALNRVANSTSTPRNVAAGIGINSTTENSADLTANANCTSVNVATPSAQLIHAALGYTYYAWLEYGAGADTQTWIGDSTIVYIDTGMIGSMVG